MDLALGNVTLNVDLNLVCDTLVVDALSLFYFKTMGVVHHHLVGPAE